VVDVFGGVVLTWLSIVAARHIVALIEQRSPELALHKTATASAA
jgi:hypothetical protein